MAILVATLDKPPGSFFQDEIISVDIPREFRNRHTRVILKSVGFCCATASNALHVSFPDISEEYMDRVGIDVTDTYEIKGLMFSALNTATGDALRPRFLSCTEHYDTDIELGYLDPIKTTFRIILNGRFGHNNPPNTFISMDRATITLEITEN